MDVVFARCAGPDMHKKTTVACVLIRAEAESGPNLRTFGTRNLRTLATWLTGLQVTHVAMESTGSDWKPIFNVLEEAFTTWLVNPAHIKAVPGRKTDRVDRPVVTTGFAPAPFHSRPRAARAARTHPLP